MRVCVYFFRIIKVFSLVHAGRIWVMEVYLKGLWAVLFVVVAIVFFLGSACIEDKLVHSPLCYGDSSYHDYLKEIE